MSNPSETTVGYIEDIDVVGGMEDSFLEYTLLIIHSQALPDAEDDLKPMQRRISFRVKQMGLTPDKGHVRSSRVADEMMGRLRPHRDATIHDALVHLTRPSNLWVSLVDGHRSSGSPDDGPVAIRCTEAHLTQAPLYLVGGSDEDTVDFVPNYDNQLQQPVVLPAVLPNLLVNGVNDITVGVATNIPPYSVRKVTADVIHLLNHPNVSLEDLMRFYPGPGLPGGGVIVGTTGIKEAYKTGRGVSAIRVHATIEQVTA